MNFIFCLVSFLFCFVFSINAEVVHSCFVLKNRDGAGMFSMFGDVLSLVHSYERGVFQGVSVDFENEGLYYESTLGSNWWEYYCEPICLGDQKNRISGYHGSYPEFSSIFFYKNREEAYELIQKHIHFRPHIITEIESFKQSNFQNHFVVGVHYRGTDAPDSSPPYEVYLEEISKVIRSQSDSNYRIFIASDEQPFIDFMEEAFPGHLCYQRNALRSDRGGEPLHKTNFYNHYLQGEEAVIDCALLSNCSFMILTYSSLSLWASLFNPYIPMLDISKKLPVVK